jgi:hypothetical protein
MAVGDVARSLSDAGYRGFVTIRAYGRDADGREYRSGEATFNIDRYSGG